MPSDSSPNAPHSAHSEVSHDSTGHVHLTLAKGDSSKKQAPWDKARWPVIGLSVASAAFFVASLWQPWWRFLLYAPQYPNGLELIIGLKGMSGDVKEIDLLNHYIGMGHLADAAPFERMMAGWGVAAIAITTLVLFAAVGKKLNKLVLIPAVSFPVVFLLDSFYWLYTFGHHLDPKAPLRIKPFTPEMFGNGVIGQFETFATPQMGFYLALGGVACAIIATFLRKKVCDNCGHAGECSVACPRAMVLPDRQGSK